jgi:hypothetical protein
MSDAPIITATPTQPEALARAPRRRGGGQPGRSGPPGNRNAMTHGVRSFLALGRAPRGAEYIFRLLGKFRRQLEATVAEVHGEVSLVHATAIHSALRHEGRALLLTRWLRELDATGEAPARRSATKAKATKVDGATLTASTTTHVGLSLLDRMAVLEGIGRATDARDKAIDRLELGKSKTVASEFAAIYAQARDVPSNGRPAPQAPSAQPEDFDAPADAAGPQAADPCDSPEAAR